MKNTFYTCFSNWRRKIWFQSWIKLKFFNNWKTLFICFCNWSLEEYYCFEVEYNRFFTSSRQASSMSLWSFAGSEICSSFCFSTGPPSSTRSTRWTGSMIHWSPEASQPEKWRLAGDRRCLLYTSPSPRD